MPKPYSTKTFGEKHGLCDSRIRQLLLQKRIFPAEKVGGTVWYIYPNAVIIPPYQRPNRQERSFRRIFARFAGVILDRTR